MQNLSRVEGSSPIMPMKGGPPGVRSCFTAMPKISKRSEFPYGFS